MLDMVLGCPLPVTDMVLPILRMMKAFRILDDLHCRQHCFIGDPAPSRVARGTIIAAPPLWTLALLSLSLFAAEGNFHSCGDEFPVHN